MKKWIAVLPLTVMIASPAIAGDLAKARNAFKEGACGLAIAELNAPAAHGDQDAQYLLGEIYSSGRHDCERDFRDEAKAQRWYQAAAEAGHLDAQKTLIYRFDDTPQQKAESDRWTRVVARRGIPDALERLARMYADGERVQRDPVVALALRTIAAAQGDKDDKDGTALRAWRAKLAAPQVAEANTLAAGWRPGAALPERSETGQRPALDWLREAAAGGEPQAAYQLARLMWDEGSPADAQAAPWLRRAAAAGIRDAQRLLARAIALEVGERRDPGLAYALNVLASDDAAAHWERELTPAQLREARQFLAKWKPGQPLPQAFASAAERKYHRARFEPARAEATPQVLALFEAARKADEPAFARALAQVAKIDDYRVDGMTLLAVLVRPDPALLEQGRELAALSGDARQARWQALRARHQAQLPARARMLAQVLARKPDLHRGSGKEAAAALHFAAMFGSPAMVRQLLAAGADPAQLGGKRNEYAPLEYALAQEDHSEGLPEMTTLEQRTETILMLLRAGAPRPFAAAIAAAAEEAKAKGKEDTQFRDYFLWRDVLWLTRSTQVLDKLEALGSKLPEPDRASSMLGEAAFAGNTASIPWLKKRIARLDANGQDRWLDAAMFALYLPPEKAKEALSVLLVDGMPWQQSGPQERHSYQRFLPMGSRRVELESTLAGHAIQAGNNALLQYVLQRGVPLPRAALSQAVRSNNVAVLQQILNPQVDVREELRYIEFGEVEVLPATILLLAQHQARAAKPTTTAEHSALLESVARHIGKPGYRQLFGQLLALGGPGDGLREQSVARIFGAQDKALAVALLDGGLAHSAAPAVRTRYLDTAIAQRRTDLLPRLLKDASVADSSWQLAVAGKDEGVLRAMAQGKPLRLDAVCMNNDAMLAGVVLESPDAFWTLLRSSGFGSDKTRCADMGERVLKYLAARPERPVAGWMGRALAVRVAELAGGKPELDARMWADLGRNGHGALTQALLAGGWHAPRANQAQQAPLSGPALALAGRYVYERGGMCELDLRKDGSFQLTSTLEGATWYARGAWRAEGDVLALESAPPKRPRVGLDAEEAGTRGGSTVSVELQARGASVPGVELLVLGDAPVALRGKTTVDGWSGTLAGPVRQIIVIDRGSRESHVVEVPAEQAMRRQFVLQAQRGEYDDPFHGKGHFSGGRLTLDMGSYPVTLERQ
ncbi:tetratricopeptide repeat protein [Massilia sp. SR12]